MNIPTIKDTEKLLDNILSALNEADSVDYVLRMDWKVAPSTAVTLKQLKTIIKKIRAACDLLQDDFLSVMELSISQDDLAGRKILLKVKELSSEEPKSNVKPTNP